MNKEIVKEFIAKKKDITTKRLNDTSIRRKKSEQEELKQEIDVYKYILRNI